ncbi:hypothetical protein KSK37_08215 [Kaistella sp. DKR-2]|uniref:serine acetyltransferase n=1 Tax=Kaistella soli TaxID=2849654 RepID=UPI001C26086C|nr:hypothetical protein [Kaistella soli]MBU8883063.1 hypothetical protein [Kaistella soli]
MLRFLSLIIFAPHVLLYLLSAQRKVILLDLYARAPVVQTSHLGQLLDLSFALMNSKYFRTLFYFRVGGFFSKVLRVFYPRSETFIIDIHSKIGAGLKLAHPYATIINAQSVGENCYINHLVTVGEKNGRRPVIGNNVELHANCTVLGGINIGDSAVIGAGAVVVKDVPAYAVAVGNPARLILK